MVEATATMCSHDDQVCAEGGRPLENTGCGRTLVEQDLGLQPRCDRGQPLAEFIALGLFVL